MKKGWSAGKIIGVTAGVIGAVIILWVAFVASVFQLIFFLERVEEDRADEYEWRYDYDEDDTGDRDWPDDQEYDDRGHGDWDDRGYDDWDDRDESGDGEYYEFENAIRDDLSYQITIESYDRDDFTPKNGGKVEMDFEYAVISGDLPNADGINRKLYEEVSGVEEHIDSLLDYLSEEDEYEYISTCYVTYMTEDVLSVVYVEYALLNDQYLESYVISKNFDMQTGMTLNNTELINMNDEFSIDFRERCEKQNGEISDLSMMSDQEMTEYLTDSDLLIIFYTPMGMEIGFNYYDGWVTVTYSDYEKYAKQF